MRSRESKAQYLQLASTTLVGAVSPTGDYAVASGGTSPGSMPELWFLVR